MKIKFPSIMIAFLVAFLALTLGSGTASAIPFFPGSGLTAGTQWEDDDIDYFIDNNGNGIIDVGDVLAAAVEITRVIDILPPLDPASPYATNQAADELVAWTVIQVIPNVVGDPANRIRFGQFGATPMIRFFTGGTNLNVFNDPTFAQASTSAQDGTLLYSFSITADPDTEWFFDPLVAGANNPAAVAGLPAATKVGTANFALNEVGPPTGLFGPQAIGGCGVLFRCLGPDDAVQLLGSADILGGLGLVNGAFARSDADVTINPVIPEPSTLSLLGLGLIAAGALRRWKKA